MNDDYAAFLYIAYDAEGQNTKALAHALTIIENEQDVTNTTYFPIILGCPWSELSTITSPALESFENGQISSGSTSILLSDADTYPYFYKLSHQHPVFCCWR